MDRRKFIKTAGGIAAASLAFPEWACRSQKSSKGGRPNIIILFADDMGFSDAGCFGGEIETPNIDSLASGGVRFTQFYNTSRCCPSRASLLTGLYPHQAGMGLMVYRDYGEGYSGKLNDSCVTFGEVLGQAGYQTMFVGKWHAGHALQARPEVRGFQRVTAVYPHIDSYWKVLEGCDVYRDKSPLIPAGENPVNPYHPDQEFYTTDFFTEAALDYIDSTRQSPDKPFLLHLCYNAPHFPLEAPDDLIAKYRGRYLQGWDILRQEKLERMMESRIVSKNQKLPRVRGYSGQKREGFAYRPVATTDFLPEWASLSADEQSELDFRRAIYAAQIDRMDWNIGRIIAHLKKHRIFDNTLILFFPITAVPARIRHTA
jgi:arylsulfatase